MRRTYRQCDPDKSDWEHAAARPPFQPAPELATFQCEIVLRELKLAHDQLAGRVDIIQTYLQIPLMKPTAACAEVSIHLRARAQDCDIIDRAAKLAGTNRCRFMLSAALKHAQKLLLDQTNIIVNATSFQMIMTRLDAEPTAEETAGMKRLLDRKPS